MQSPVLSAGDEVEGLCGGFQQEGAAVGKSQRVLTCGVLEAVYQTAVEGIEQDGLGTAEIQDEGAAVRSYGNGIPVGDRDNAVRF